MLNIIKLYWLLKTSLCFRLFGPYGVSHCVERMPHFLIIYFLIKYGAKVGTGCNIERGIVLHRPNPIIPFKNLTIGDRVYIGHETILDLTSKITIDSNSALGARCQIWTHTGDWTLDRKDEKEFIEPVTIGKSVILYSGVIVSPGVNIGNFARVAAGSVVNKDIKESEFWGGIPAKFIKIRTFNI